MSAVDSGGDGPASGTLRGARVRALLLDALSVVAALVLFVLMMLTAVDVIGRYVFNRPLPGP